MEIIMFVVPAQEEKKSGNIKAFGNIFIAFVGAGVLGLPHAFQRAGLVQGPLFMVVVAALAMHCMLLLVQCKRCALLPPAGTDTALELHTSWWRNVILPRLYGLFGIEQLRSDCLPAFIPHDMVNQGWWLSLQGLHAVGCRKLEHRGIVSFSEVARATLGPVGQRVVETLLVLSQTGAKVWSRFLVTTLRLTVCHVHVLAND